MNKEQYASPSEKFEKIKEEIDTNLHGEIESMFLGLENEGAKIELKNKKETTEDEKEVE